MALLSIDASDRDLVRRVRWLLRRRLGRDAEAVFGEGIQNVMRHTPDARALLILHTRWFELIDTGPGITLCDPARLCEERDGQGGYGLGMIAALGAELITDPAGTRVIWRQMELQLCKV